MEFLQFYNVQDDNGGVSLNYLCRSFLDGWMGGWMDGWMEGWMDGWMNGWMDMNLINRE